MKFVQKGSVSVGTGASITVTLSGTAAGNSVVLLLTTSNTTAGPAASVQNTSGDSYSPLVDQVSAVYGNQWAAVYWLPVARGGTETVVITFSPSGWGAAQLLEVSGARTSGQPAGASGQQLNRTPAVIDPGNATCTAPAGGYSFKADTPGRPTIPTPPPPADLPGYSPSAGRDIPRPVPGSDTRRAPTTKRPIRR